MLNFVAPAAVTEGDPVSIQVVLSRAVTYDVTFQWMTVPNTAVEFTNYYPASWTTVTIPAGTRVQSLDVMTVDNEIAEASKSFIVAIGSVTGARLLNSDLFATINDNDSTYKISANFEEPSLNGR